MKTEDKQEESGELGRKMDDRKGDEDGGFLHTRFFSVKINAYVWFLYERQRMNSSSNDNICECL
jgi:hypothetical protein